VRVRARARARERERLYDNKAGMLAHESWRERQESESQRERERERESACARERKCACARARERERARERPCDDKAGMPAHGSWGAHQRDGKQHDSRECCCPCSVVEDATTALLGDLPF